MCYGIAIHIDDEADFEYERTPLAMSVGDADNIDRYDAYLRLYESLHVADYIKTCRWVSKRGIYQKKELKDWRNI